MCVTYIWKYHSCRIWGGCSWASTTHKKLYPWIGYTWSTQYHKYVNSLGYLTSTCIGIPHSLCGKFSAFFLETKSTLLRVLLQSICIFWHLICSFFHILRCFLIFYFLYSTLRCSRHLLNHQSFTSSLQYGLLTSQALILRLNIEELVWLVNMTASPQDVEELCHHQWFWQSNPERWEQSKKNEKRKCFIWVSKQGGKNERGEGGRGINEKSNECWLLYIYIYIFFFYIYIYIQWNPEFRVRVPGGDWSDKFIVTTAKKVTDVTSQRGEFSYMVIKILLN